MPNQPPETPAKRPRVRFLPLAAVIITFGTGLSGCSGSGGGADPVAQVPAPAPAATGDCSTDPASCGTVLVGLTDADGDFLTYSVEVESLSLQRADGAQVETMPNAAVVDFAQYTDLTEFLSAATVPSGTYVSGSLTLDYAGADISVERDGLATPTVVTDIDGNPLGVASYTVKLADDRPLVVRPGLPSVLVVDFDLNASHSIDLAADPVTAVAEPFLLADIEPLETKTIRVRGPLLDVDVDAGTYTVALRPFRLRQGNFGRLTVHTGEGTAFEVDGVTLVGSDGLRAMADLPDGTATIAGGTLDVPARRFEANQVLAGTSVPGGQLDAVAGHVFARDGLRLAIRGATLDRANGSASFNDTIFVTIAATTRVVKAGEPGFDGGIGAISVGQSVTVFGSLTDSTTDSLTLDATIGGVRLWPTRMSGVVDSVNAGLITVELRGIGKRNPARFDFTGTGVAGMDADPNAYEVDTGNIDTGGVLPQAPVKFSGFVAPFGLAPPDFTADTVVEFSGVRATLDITWKAVATGQFVQLDANGIGMDLDNPDIARRHHLRRASIVQPLEDLVPPPVIVTRTDGTGLYAIRDGRSVQLFLDFAVFTRTLAEHIGAGRTAIGLHASGRYDDTSGQFSAGRVAARLR